MARAGAPKNRKEKRPTGHRPLDVDGLLKRQNELVGEIWRYYHMISTRNLILQRLQDHLTQEEKNALAQG